MFDEQEQNEPKLTAELAALESRLCGLRPATPQIDRDRLMFAAGRAAEQGPRPLATTIRVRGRTVGSGPPLPLP